MRKLFLPIIALSLCFSQTACDLIAAAAGVDKVDVPTETFAGNLAINANTTEVVTQTVNITEEDLPDVFDVNEVTIKKEDVEFTANTLTKTAASGTISVTLIIDEQPCAYATATIENNVVTKVEPTPIGIGANLSAMQTLLSTANPNQVGTLRSNWQNLTIDQVIDLISTAIKTKLSNLKVSLAVKTTGNISGRMKIKKFTLGLDF
jgi:hypothetical protein